MARILGFPTITGMTIVGSIGAVTIVVLVGLVIGETMRDRWGLKAAGVIALPLVALFALRAWWVVPLYVGIFGLSYVAVQLVHRFTLLYGRALLSLAAVVGVVLGFPAIVAFGLADAVTVFFAGLIAGIGAYNLHWAAPADRPATVIVLAGAFVVTYALARVLVDPLATGLAATVGVPDLVSAALAIAAAIWVLARYEKARPGEAALRDGAVPIQEVAR